MPKKSRQNRLPGDAYSAKVHARVWIIGENRQHYLGVGKVRLMELIDELGSISQAAKVLDMSYKRAWTLVEEVNQLGAPPFVVKEVGGAGGGHAVLTDAGRAAIAQYRSLEADLSAFLKARGASLA